MDEPEKDVAMDTTEIEQASILDINIQALCLSRRTTNALMKAGVLTVRDLISLSEIELKKMRGLGGAGIEEITRAVMNFLDSEKEYSLHEWIRSACSDQRQLELIERYYSLRGEDKITMRVLAAQYNLSGARVGQLILKFQQAFQVAARSGVADARIMQILSKAADEQTKICDIPQLSSEYENEAVIRLFAKETGELAVYSDKRLANVWLVRDEAQFKGWVDEALEWLLAQEHFVPLDKIVQEAGVPEKVILDLRGVQLDEGYVFLGKEYRKVNRKEEHVQLLVDLLRQNCRPCNVSELAEATGLALERVRGLLLDTPGVVNVGRSMYALEEYGYSGKDIKALLIEYLEQAGEPVKKHDLVKYVLHRRQVEERSVETTLQTMTDIFTMLDGGFVALAEWGYSPRELAWAHYDVKASEAVLSVLDHEAMMSNRDILEKVQERYGEKATDSIVTISMVTSRLAREERLAEVTIGKAKYYRLAV